MKKTNKSHLLDLVDKIDWMMIEPVRTTWRMPDSAVAVRFHAADLKKSGEINKVTIRIGREVISRMKWSAGDRICIYNDPDHLLTFKLVKSESGTGYKLNRETNSFTHAISFRWPHTDLKLEHRKSKEVKYDIYKNNLIIFKVDNNSENDE